MTDTAKHFVAGFYGKPTKNIDSGKLTLKCRSWGRSRWRTPSGGRLCRRTSLAVSGSWTWNRPPASDASRLRRSCGPSRPACPASARRWNRLLKLRSDIRGLRLVWV